MSRRFFARWKSIESPSRRKLMESMDVLREVQLMKSEISPELIRGLNEKGQAEFMTRLWSFLISLAEEDDIPISIAARGAIGVIVFSISPVIANITTDTFSNVIMSRRGRAKASIVTVSTFLNLIHTISPVNVPAFVKKTPVLIDFCGDVRACGRDLPHLITLVGPLDSISHKILFHSLFEAFARNPDQYFIDSVIKLIRINPETLINELVRDLQEESMMGAMLALGPAILADDRIFDLAGRAVREQFAAVALNVLDGEACSVVDLEQACNTLANLIRRADGEELQTVRFGISERLKDKYPRHFHRFLLAIASDFEVFKFKVGDSLDLMCSKMEWLSRYLRKTQCESDVRQSLVILREVFAGEGNHLLLNALAVLRECFDLLVNVDRKETGSVLLLALKRNNMSWVQCCGLLQCIGSIGVDAVYELIDDFEKIIVDMVVKWSYSQQDELSDRALLYIEEIVNIDNADVILGKARDIDIFDPFMAGRFVVIMNSLFDGMKALVFAQFAPLVAELIKLHTSVHVAGAGFSFLYKVGYFIDSPVLANICIDWIVRIYQSVTQCTSSVQSPLSSGDELNSVLSGISTDIVSSSIHVVRRQTLKPLKACVEYYLALVRRMDKYTISLIYDVVHLFPELILGRLVERPEKLFGDFNDIVARMLSDTSSFTTAAVCCEFLCSPDAGYTAAPADIEVVKALIQHERAISGSVVLSFFRFLLLSNVDDAVLLLMQAKDRMSQNEVAVLDGKMCVGDRRSYTIFVANRPFSDWPIHDTGFCRLVESQTKNITVRNFDDIDGEHWVFIFGHLESFDHLAVAEFRKRRPHFMKKFEPSSVNTAGFVFAELEIKQSLQSALPVIVKRQSIDDHMVLKRFFMFTKYELQQDIFDTVFVNCVKNADDVLLCVMIAYAEQHGLAFNKLLLLERWDVITKSPELMRLLCHHLCVGDVERPDHVDLTSIDVDIFGIDALVLVVYGNDIIAKCLSFVHIKASLLIHLGKMVYRFKLVSPVIADFCMDNIDKMIDKPKRLVACLRLLRLVLTSVNDSRVLLDKLVVLLDSPFVAVHRELSQIMLCVLVNVELCDNRIMKCLTTANEISGTFSPYFGVLAMLYSYTDFRVDSVNKNAIFRLFCDEFSTPSILLSGFGTIETLVKGGSRGRQLFRQTTEYFLTAAARVHDQPIFDATIDDILTIVVKRREFMSHSTGILFYVCDLVFASQPNSPSFPGRVSVISSVIPLLPPSFKKYETFISALMSSENRDPKGLVLFVDNYKRMITRRSETNLRLDMSRLLQDALSEILRVHSDANVSALMDILRLPFCDVDVAFAAVTAIAFLDAVPFHDLVIMMTVVKKMCCPEQVEMCRDKIACLRRSLHEKQRMEMFDKVLMGDSIGALAMTDMLYKTFDAA